MPAGQTQQTRQLGERRMILTAPLAVPTSVTAGAATPIGQCGRKTVEIDGVVTQTIQIQISLDTTNPPAASSWINEGAPFTNAGGMLEITKPCIWVRVNVTAYTS